MSESQNPLFRVTGRKTLDQQDQKLNMILEEVRAIRAAITGPAKPPEPPPPPPDPSPKPPSPPTEPAPTGPNPFVAWRAQGYDLVYIQMWLLHRGLTAEELAQARAAGYDASPSPGTGAPGAPPADDFDRASPHFGWHFGRSKVREGAAGAVFGFIITPPPGTRGTYAVKIAETTSALGHVDLVDVWFHPAVGGASGISGTFYSVPFSVRRDGPIEFFVRFHQAGAISIQLNNL